MARTIEKVETELKAVRAAYLAILQGQEYRIGNRWLTRADLATVVKEKQKLEREMAGIVTGGRGGLRVWQVVPRD